MRVLLIEDDSATAQHMELMLRSEGMHVYSTELGEEGLDLGRLYEYDIILLDLNLPDMPGFDVLEKLRSGGIKTPVMIVSGTAHVATKVTCFGLGADDYVCKPFHKDELVARIRAIVRRSAGHATPTIIVDRLEINIASRKALVDGNQVALTGKEFETLEMLALSQESFVSKDQLLNGLYGGMDTPDIKIVDVYICKLRKKIMEKTDGPSYIDTIWGKGYCLSKPEALAA